MALITPTHQYLYSFRYDYHHHDLCKLESRQIFNDEGENKVLFTNLKVDPSISPFIKNRLEIISCAENYSELLESILDENIRMNGFKAEYLILEGDEAERPERREKLTEIGYRIAGRPDFDNPIITYSICHHKNVWYFGVLAKHDSDWLKHSRKPCSFSNSICMKIAKTLVSVATQGNKDNTLLDACCGVGTIMLEACISGFQIEGCEINPKTCKHTRQNLAHYDYSSAVYSIDVKDLDKQYDAAILDLPYNLYSYSNDSIIENIIESTAKLTGRIIIVSISDIEPVISKSGLRILDFCTVEKRGKSKFSRNIWVCEKNANLN